MTKGEQQLWDQVGNLMMDLNVARLVLIHLAAETFKREPDPLRALVRFTDEVHSSIDTAPQPPAAIVARMEQMRMGMDEFMSAIQQRL